MCNRRPKLAYGLFALAALMVSKKIFVESFLSPLPNKFSCGNVILNEQNTNKCSLHETDKERPMENLRPRNRVVRAALFLRRSVLSPVAKIKRHARVPASSETTYAKPTPFFHRVRRSGGAVITFASAVVSAASELAEPLLEGGAAEAIGGAVEEMDLNAFLEQQKTQTATLQTKAAVSGGMGPIIQKLAPLAIIIYIFFIAKPADDGPKGKGVPRPKGGNRN
mmetsp:Transcript_11124/g.24569  ORF Transcript_11124/g.24569 Transcript_11124/m.24569 type:complete len:223 (-) Transcript_11124:93-761(-)|eukprot:CAMPEP_0113299122 /NCGR_PEP_ID=MMETSP0010_2-20120614/1287_1 /TAXON_ID=216773 ORGANISM="Corethron hystrix, Strain 308" /NCGR_SAMPLE_ID=MMETSP0010_2 /ASSEMBLY_ACC=CAM_ASM_000155 /LENGTH=222 /DNA_ID=CAMNT_0000152301 /DNA_START=137 /DNA_END=805 /DNA_ORIENTATION=+ /assembly_acc=CAM_ASM_000155